MGTQGEAVEGMSEVQRYEDQARELAARHGARPVHKRLVWFPDPMERMVEVLDEAGPNGSGGAYAVCDAESGRPLGVFSFQRGAESEEGRNGVTEVALLRIMIDRLEARKRAGFAAAEVDDALGCLRGALDALVELDRRRVVAELAVMGGALGGDPGAPAMDG